MAVGFFSLLVAVALVIIKTCKACISLIEIVFTGSIGFPFLKVHEIFKSGDLGFDGFSLCLQLGKLHSLGIGELSLGLEGAQFFDPLLVSQVLAVQ
ncbi:hypothetical protein IMSAGC015_02151 [Lachnospiraceae bacterium]|nr:hypothetical protein IMSAGC015_02151 [Lachnospiraceae bacterium]